MFHRYDDGGVMEAKFPISVLSGMQKEIDDPIA
jgi:hypothetical protein